MCDVLRPNDGVLLFRGIYFSFLIKSSFGYPFLITTYVLLDGVQLDQTKSLNILFLIDRLLGGRKDGRKGMCLLSSSPRADRASNISRWV